MFRNYLFEASGLYDNMKRCLLKSIYSARASKGIGNLELQRTLIEMFVEVGLFGKFETSLINESYSQYETEIFNENFKSFEYVEQIEFFLIFEERFTAVLGLPKETQNKLIKIVEKLLLSDHISTIVSSGLAILIESTWSNSKVDIVEPPINDFSELQKGNVQSFDLRLLVKLAYRVNALDLLKLNWANFIKSYGSTILSTSAEESLIEDLLQFKTRLEVIVGDIFGKDPVIENSLKESFETFVNQRQSRLAELIAQYLDRLLRDGKNNSSSERLPDNRLIELIDQVIILFRYLQSKDAVELAYKRLLSKRLLQNRTISINLEKEIVKRFKNECGAQFTSRFEGMFKDFEASPDLNIAFKSSSQFKEALIDFNVTVVSGGIWPHPDDVLVNLPVEISTAQENFASFYGIKFNGRHLSWNNNMGYCIIKANFPQGMKELQVSIPQAIVLSAFNGIDKLSVSEIMSLTNLTFDAVKKTLASLSSSRHQILNKEDPNDKISKADVFAYNSGFTSRLVRIRLNSFTQTKVSEEKAPINPQQSDDMQHRIDAAIIRIIKAERKMKRTDLAQRTMSTLNLNISGEEVGKRIDILMTRDFMAEDKEDSSYLIYVP